jgi:hypothetical protein
MFLESGIELWSQLCSDHGFIILFNKIKTEQKQKEMKKRKYKDALSIVNIKIIISSVTNTHTCA